VADGSSSDLTRLILDWVAACMNPDDEVRGTIKKLRARARELFRNNAYVAAYVNLLSGSVVGAHGMTLQAKVRDNSGKLNPMINGKIEEAWLDWADNPVTADGTLAMVDYTDLALTTTSIEGESLTRFMHGDRFNHGLALAPIDSDLLDEKLNRRRHRGENEIRMGVEVDALGTRISYHVFKEYGSVFSGGGRDTEAVPAAEIIHMMRGRRVNQTRGTTWLGPTMIALRMLEGYEESELVAARVAASKMGFFQTRMPETAGEFGPQSSKDPIKMEANPGTLEQLPVGWEFKEWSPDHPTTQFPAFVKGNLRKIATGLGVSYNALASDLEGVNYSSMRSGLLIERATWKRLQAWWIRQFMQRVYREWLASALSRRVLVLDQRDFRRFYAVRWQPQGFPWVDPAKEAQAAEVSIRNGLTSRTRLLAEQGIDFEDVLEELAEEKQLAAEKGVQIEPKPEASQATGDDDEDKDKDAGGENGNGRAEVIAAARERRR